MRSMKDIAVLNSIAVFGLAAGCTVGPKNQRASAPVPAKWDVSEPWREGAPKDGVPKGEWWSVFHDEELNALEKQTLDANQTIKIASARLEQARASAAVQIATQFPALITAPQPERQRLSGNRPAGGSFPVISALTQNSFTLPFTAGYEVDLFGRRRRSIEAAQAAYQASAADLENVRLVITSELAGDYFTARQLDTELGILNRTVETLQKGLQLVDSRHKGGVASGLDVAQEETLLNTTRTQFAKAGYDASIASYRNTVLSAFGEVQDDVTGLMVLDQAFHSQEQAVDAARRTLNISTDRYTGGLVNYLDVVTAQQTLLNNEQQLAAIRGQRLVTSVLLIKALGGGWDASSLAAVQVKTKLKGVVAP